MQIRASDTLTSWRQGTGPGQRPEEFGQILPPAHESRQTRSRQKRSKDPLQVLGSTTVNHSIASRSNACSASRQEFTRSFMPPKRRPTSASAFHFSLCILQLSTGHAATPGDRNVLETPESEG